MNRDLRDVIYVDFDDSKAMFHKDNVIVLPRWEGDPNDRELYDLLPFLESNIQSVLVLFRYLIATSGCKRRN